MNCWKIKMLTFLIMAGGSGERFWPLSTKENPKQLLHIFDEKSLLRLTYERILPITDNKHIFVATNKIQAKRVKEELKELDASRIIIEPDFKDTASAICYGSLIISKYIPDPTIAVLASDHLIKDEDKFRMILNIAEAKANEGKIVTLGIKPTYPETGYGYIEAEDNKLNWPCKAISFKEKPNVDVAIEYIKKGNYLWNSGMFIFKRDVIMSEFKKYSPNHFETTVELDMLIDKNNGIITANKVQNKFNEYEKKSIDFAVMEKSDLIEVIPCDIGWNDVGGYLAFEELFQKDENGNVKRFVNCISLDSNNNIIISENKNLQRVALLDVSDMIIVITKTDILILPKNRSQEIKKLIKLMPQE